METLGVVAFCHGFNITSLCTLHGNHHILLSYLPSHDLSAFPDDIQTSIAEQTKTSHSLAYYDNSARDQALVSDDVKTCYKHIVPPVVPLWVC